MIFLKRVLWFLMVIFFISFVACTNESLDFINEEEEYLNDDNINNAIINDDLNLLDDSNLNDFNQQEVEYQDFINFIQNNFNENSKTFSISTYGSSVKSESYTNNAFKFSFEELKVIQDFISSSNSNRVGTKINKVEFIVIHDTKNNSKGANALSHSKLVKSSGFSSSWHYVVDSNNIINNIPTNEVAYHAGDGLRSFQLIDTKIKAVSNNCNVTVSKPINNKVYFVVDGIQTQVVVPLVNNTLATNNDLVDIFCEVGSNGNYFISKTYYNSTYKKISNTGGGSNGIGIEACIDEGSDIYKTLQNTAKLTASLLIEHNLDINRVLQHNNFSGKNCPQTIRRNDLWDNFLELVQAELDYINLSNKYQFEITSKTSSNYNTIDYEITIYNKKINLTHKLGL